jgi:hypothetical protein
VGKVISIKRDGDDLVIVAARGTDDGVDKSWKLELLTESGKPITTATLEILMVHRKTTDARVRGPKTLPNNQTVRFSPR